MKKIFAIALLSFAPFMVNADEPLQCPEGQIVESVLVEEGTEYQAAYDEYVFVGHKNGFWIHLGNGNYLKLPAKLGNYNKVHHDEVPATDPVYEDQCVDDPEYQAPEEEEEEENNNENEEEQQQEEENNNGGGSEESSSNSGSGGSTAQYEPCMVDDIRGNCPEFFRGAELEHWDLYKGPVTGNGTVVNNVAMQNIISLFNRILDMFEEIMGDM